ncbi:sulfatase family protein [Aporhodopirellula aestuarii]|uniref:Sulfatase-like hydrolase/transferase n=1 Tax=Aporhodopirellula aestuarii TaxID=2950107 RepID=A0ABT0U0M9_9BACT|nr:sulfatase-like hydrolase/transferase [Aporhodopirellula aestuarii]MCM2370120.1 sulfatase-like hydrolase/transferase [Aporhodopirellula aestuarii]
MKNITEPFTGPRLRVALLVIPLVLLAMQSDTVDAAEPGDSRPNILLITTDQQFADAMGCAGSEGLNTPAMDEIAKRGVRFTNAYVNYPVCLPERYSMYTGRLPCTRRLADAKNKPIVSLGNQAKLAGYRTAYFGKWHIQDQTFSTKDRKHHGFDVYTSGRDATITENAVGYLSQPNDTPFLLVTSYYNPHDICEWGRKKAGVKEKKATTMRNGDVSISPPLEDCPPLPDNYEINADEAEAVMRRRNIVDKKGPNAQKMAMSFDRDQWRQYRWAYNRLVELVDNEIGQVLAALKENGLDENTVVIFTSDHGDGCGAHRWHQKSILYEESCRVPFIIRWPGQSRVNEIDDRLVSVGIDLMPTISEIVGTPMPDGPYFGLSALPFALDEHSPAPTHRYVVTEAEVDDDVSYKGRSVRTPNFKYHRWSDGSNREQLFDMVNDRGETNNLAQEPEFADVLEAHRKMLADWIERTDDTYTDSEAVVRAYGN